MVVLAQLTGFVIIVESHIRYIYSRPVLTKVTNRHVDKLPFPGVTVCSHIPAINLTLETLKELRSNVLKSSGLGSNDLHSSDLGENALKSSDLGNTFPTSSHVLSKALPTQLPQEGIDKPNLSVLPDKIQELLQVEHIEQCVFASKNCSDYIRKFFSEELQPRLCYTINGFVDHQKIAQTFNSSSSVSEDERKLPVLESLAPGSEGGLSLKINVQDTVKTGVQVSVCLKKIQ